MIKPNKRQYFCTYKEMNVSDTYISNPFRTLLVTYTLYTENHHRVDIQNRFRQLFCLVISSIDCLPVEREPYFDQFSFGYELYKRTGTLSILEEPEIFSYSNGVVRLLCSNVRLLSE